MKISTAYVATFLILGALPVRAFESPEHRNAGDAAWAQAVGGLDADHKAALLRLLAQAPGVKPTPEEPVCAQANGTSVASFSFGQLVAIYGDWAKDTAEVNAPGLVPRVRLLKAITAQGAKVADQGEYDHMIQLASVNFTHFSGEALAAYVHWHDQALAAAADPNRLTEALHYEALALHSYTDLFALGHMLEDRELTKAITNWANNAKNSMAIRASGYGALVLGGMTNFYHNAYNWRGAMVTNSAGDQWFATGDGKYLDADNPRQRERVVQGAAASLHQVLATALGLPSPQGSRYSAVRFLPVRYEQTREPVAPKDQVARILALIPAQKLKGNPIETGGFDFSLGILAWKDGEKKGVVAYAAKVEELLRR